MGGSDPPLSHDKPVIIGRTEVFSLVSILLSTLVDTENRLENNKEKRRRNSLLRIFIERAQNLFFYFILYLVTIIFLVGGYYYKWRHAREAARKYTRGRCLSTRSLRPSSIRIGWAFLPPNMVSPPTRVRMRVRLYCP